MSKTDDSPTPIIATENDASPRAGDKRAAVLQVLYDYFDGDIGNDEAVDRIVALFS